MRWTLVTGNENKWREAERILGSALDRVALDLPEIQAAHVRDVAVEKAKIACETLGRAVVVEDAGLELAALGGFPGPFVKFWEQLGGLRSICRALDGSPDRAASAVCVLALRGPDGLVVVEGRIDGTIAPEPRGGNGFGWDAIFVPEGETRTFAEMTGAEKDAVSHRRRAWEKLRALGA